MAINFRRPNFPIPVPQRNNAGNNRASVASLLNRCSVDWLVSAILRPIVLTVRVEEPRRPATDMGLSEQARDGPTAGEILQLNLTLDGLNPAAEVMVIVD